MDKNIFSQDFLDSVQKRSPDFRKESRPPSSSPKLRRKKPTQNNPELEVKFKELTEQLEEDKQKNRMLYINYLKTQEHYIKREKEFKRTLMDYEKILFPYLSQNDFTSNSRDKIRRTHQKVQEKIELVQTQTVRFLQDHERLIVRELNQELNSFHRGLLDSQKSSSAKIISVDKKALHEEIIKNRAKVESVESQNNLLHKTNTELKIQFKSHENDVNILNEHIERLKQQNFKLKKELKSLTDRESSKKTFTGSKTVRNERPQISRNQETQIENFKKMIELEKKNLRAARNAYTRELQDRNELENILRMSFDGDVISPRPVSKGKKEDTKREVIKNLYYKTFPLKNKSKQNQEQELDSEALIDHLDKNIDFIEKLYSQHEENLTGTERFLKTYD